MAFQNPTLLPWKTIRDNVMLPLKIVPPFRQEFRSKRKTEFRDRVDALLKQVGLAGFGDKYPWQLSGGMMQRASLCRALIHDPQLLMLDEPFGALDQFTREELWAIMQDLWMSRKPTVLLVTHDLKEAGFLANRICVMQARPGRIIDDTTVPFARPRSIEHVLFARIRHHDPAAARTHHRQPPAEGGRVMNPQVRRRIASAALIIGFFLLWEFLCRAFSISDMVVPKPSQIIATLWQRFPAAVAAYRADALHHAGRLRLRHPDRHFARHAGRRRRGSPMTWPIRC